MNNEGNKVYTLNCRIQSCHGLQVNKSWVSVWEFQRKHLTVSKLLSCASSRTMTLYWLSSLSRRNSLRRHPSVMYLIAVSKRWRKDHHLSFTQQSSTITDACISNGLGSRSILNKRRYRLSFNNHSLCTCIKIPYAKQDVYKYQFFLNVVDQKSVLTPSVEIFRCTL